MRIAYLVSQYPAVTHTFILREIRGLRSLGVDVRPASILACDRPSKALSAEEREEAAVTFYIRPIGVAGHGAAQIKLLLRRPGAFLYGLALAIKLSRWNLRMALRHILYFSEAVVTGLWMESQGVRHLHTHFASTPALLVRAMFPVTMSMTIHGPDEFNDAVGFLLPEKVGAANFVIAISNYGCSQLMRFSRHEDWAKIHVVRLGVSPQEFSRPPTDFRVEDELEIICVGRLAPQKAQFILLQACALLIQRGRRIRLRLVGGGPDRQQLEIRSADLGIDAHVIFEGPLSHDRVLALYQAADLFVLASFAEGLPVVLMEAMAMEIPCVATCITGIPELIEHGASGLLVPPASPAALADAVDLLIENADLRRQLGTAGRLKILKEYDLEANTKQLYEIYNRFSGSHRH